MATKTPPAAPAPKKENTWNARNIHQVPHDMPYYFKCIGGGILSCGTTHTAVCPLDVVKCNMQVSPQKYNGLLSGFKLVIKEEGAGTSGIWKGYLPTCIGYSCQGAFKFGFYEIFKDFYMNLLGREITEKWTGVIWLSAAASAEFFADIALCPMEMVKVKMQTSAKGTVPLNLMGAVSYMRNTPGTGFPFKSIVPLWSRQIPYTMAKFYFFERIVRLFYAYVLTSPRDSYSKATQLSVTFASGYLAGIICAIVSHPADTLVSLRGKPIHAGKSYGVIAKEFGYSKLFTKGLGTRIIMIGTLTGLQWWIYDTYKAAFGMGSSGH